MIVGGAFLSHTPYLDRARARSDVEQRFHQAVAKAAAEASRLEPSLVVIFFPDHFNGFFYGLMPPYCIGMAAHSIGDFGTVPGKLDVAEELAGACAAFCLGEGCDVAMSHDMRVDHGAAQPLELLFPEAGHPPVLPIFINCAAPPLPTMGRVVALGQAIGRWAQTTGQRILVIGSGGISHDPPLPNFQAMSGAARQALISGGEAGHRQRLARQSRVFNLGSDFAAGQASSIRSLNPAWDDAILTRLEAGDVDLADIWDDHGVTREAGRGAQEMRCWVAALAAMSAQSDYRMERLFLEEVPEWITSTAVSFAWPV